MKMIADKFSALYLCQDAFDVASTEKVKPFHIMFFNEEKGTRMGANQNYVRVHNFSNKFQLDAGLSEYIY